MRRLYVLSLSLLSALVLFTSCDDDDEEDSRTRTYTTEAKLTWSGPYAADGCGYLLEIGEKTYKPTNEDTIPETYKSSSPSRVEVNIIDYRKKTALVCGLSKTEMQAVKVLSLRRL